MASTANLLESIAAEVGLAPSKIFPKDLRDVFAAKAKTGENLKTARNIEQAAEAEVEDYLARKADHEAEQAEGSPLDFSPFAEEAPNIERLRAMVRAYQVADRRATSAVRVATGDPRLAVAYGKLWRDFVAVEITPNMTVAQAAGIEATSQAVRSVLVAAILGNAQAGGATEREVRLLRRDLKNATETAPTLDAIIEKLTGRTKAEQARDRKAAEKVTAENNRLAQEAALSAQARVRRIVEEANPSDD